jgi:hypothetical protein
MNMNWLFMGLYHAAAMLVGGWLSYVHLRRRAGQHDSHSCCGN